MITPPAGMTQEQSRGTRRLILGLAILGSVLLVAGIAALVVLFNFGSAEIHGFRNTSNSMCPTICEGEFVLGDMAAYSKHAPARGDVVFYDHPLGNGRLYLKRIIGLPGDTVAVDDNGKILVNGKPLPLPLETSVCGKPSRAPTPSSTRLFFESTIVPRGGLFLIGDNLDNSFDSRIAGFGSATLDRVRGKALLIYWSPGSGRMGCSIR
jgi:signal peptidase I